MELCFGGFVSWSDPIITSNDLDHLCDLMYAAVPQQVSAIMSMFGYDIKQNQGRSAHLVDKFFPRMTLFQLMSIARVQNKKKVLLWSSIGAAVAYGCSSKYATQRIPVFFGYSCTTDTLLKLTLPFCNPDEYYHRVDRAMDSCGRVSVLFEGDTAPTYFQVSIGMFDNSQRNQRLKFQRGGSSGHYVRLTSRAYLVPWQGAWKDAPIPKTVVMPSVAGMPAYERLLDAVSITLLLPSVIINSASESISAGSEPAFDLSGRRVTAGYMKTVRCATVLRSIHRHLSTQRAYSFELAVYREGQANNQTVLAQLLNQQRDRVGLLHLAASFLHRSVLQYRGLRPKASLNCLPCLGNDEVTNEGMAHVATKMNLRGRLLIPNPVKTRDVPVMVSFWVEFC
jgi:hypothetical protein